jgi:hypothetical protein
MADVEPDNQGTLFRVGGVSAFALGSSFLVITALYVLVGAGPGGREAWLEYLGRTRPSDGQSLPSPYLPTFFSYRMGGCFTSAFWWSVV